MLVLRSRQARQIILKLQKLTERHLIVIIRVHIKFLHDGIPTFGNDGFWNLLSPGQHGRRPRQLRHDRYHGPDALGRPVCRFQLRPRPCGDDGLSRHGQQPHGRRHCRRRRCRGREQKVIKKRLLFRTFQSKSKPPIPSGIGDFLRFVCILSTKFRNFTLAELKN